MRSRNLKFFIGLVLVLLVRAAVADVNLLAFGDWGEDSPAEAAVASAMKVYVDRSHIKPDAVLLLGDNFYVKLPGGVNDPHWKKLFEQMYDPTRLAMPFYAVLGNHDCEENRAEIELDYAKQNPRSRFKMPARWYRVDWPAVTVLALDSNRDKLSPSQWAEQTRWLETELAKPRGNRWVICYAHHPLFSDSEHGDDPALQKDWGPVFKNQKVDFYLAGHDHCQEHLQIPGWVTSFVVAGGGGAETYPMKRHDRATFAASEHGFVHLRITADKARVIYVNENGKPLHVFERDRQGEVKIESITTNVAVGGQP